VKSSVLVALIKDDTYELAKMAVTERARVKHWLVAWVLMLLVS